MTVSFRVHSIERTVGIELRWEKLTKHGYKRSTATANSGSQKRLAFGMRGWRRMRRWFIGDNSPSFCLLAIGLTRRI